MQRESGVRSDAAPLLLSPPSRLFEASLGVGSCATHLHLYLNCGPCSCLGSSQGVAPPPPPTVVAGSSMDRKLYRDRRKDSSCSMQPSYAMAISPRHPKGSGAFLYFKMS